MVKPDAIGHVEEIIELAEKAGFTVAQVGCRDCAGRFMRRRLDLDPKAEDEVCPVRCSPLSLLVPWSPQKRRVQLKPEQCSEFYEEHYGKVFFTSLVTFMSSGPVMALVLAKEDAIASWRQLIGPTDSAKARESNPSR